MPVAIRLAACTKIICAASDFYTTKNNTQLKSCLEERRFVAADRGPTNNDSTAVAVVAAAGRVATPQTLSCTSNRPNVTPNGGSPFPQLHEKGRQRETAISNQIWIEQNTLMAQRGLAVAFALALVIKEIRTDRQHLRALQQAPFLQPGILQFNICPLLHWISALGC